MTNSHKQLTRLMTMTSASSDSRTRLMPVRDNMIELVMISKTSLIDLTKLKMRTRLRVLSEEVQCLKTQSL